VPNPTARLVAQKAPNLILDLGDRAGDATATRSSPPCSMTCYESQGVGRDVGVNVTCAPRVERQRTAVEVKQRASTSAIAGMVTATPPPSAPDKPVVAATMFGVTTPAVEAARGRLEELRYEVLVFPATAGSHIPSSRAAWRIWRASWRNSRPRRVGVSGGCVQLTDTSLLPAA
jgi:hypothetical protein